MSDGTTACDDRKPIVRDFIENNFYYIKEDMNLTDEDSLTDKGIIDSTGVLELIEFLEETFDISIENDEVIPDNLDSLEKINKFLNGKK